MSTDAPLAPPPAETTVDLTTKIEAPVIEQEAPKDEPQPEAKADDVGDLTEGEEGEQPEKKNVPGSQKLKRRLALIEQDFTRANERLAEYERREREAQQRQQQPTARPGIDREPTEQDFPNDYLAYERAKVAWDVRQSVREEFRGQLDNEQTQRAQRQRAEQVREHLLAYEEGAETARERIPDFDKVVSTANIDMKREVLEELLASEKSALLQYHLAKNPDKARALNGMSGKELAKEIGRLESRVHLPTAKKATEAEPPPAQVRGAAAPPVDAQSGPDDMNAYVAWRRQQSAKAS
jgi:hypothetical protein